MNALVARQAKRRRQIGTGALARSHGGSSRSGSSSRRAAPLFSRDAAATIARAARLRRDLGVGYAGAVQVCELLARIGVLERRLRRYERTQTTA